MTTPTLVPVGELDRKSYLGGSDAAAIMGVGATYRGETQTPMTVYLKKIGVIPDELDPATQRFLSRRKRMEPYIVEMLREEFDGEIVNINQRYRDPEYPFIATEIDFEWLDHETNLIENGEIKTVSSFAYGEKHGWGEPGTDNIPVYHAGQVMDGLMVTGRRKTIVAAMVGLDDMKFYMVKRDEETIATMRAEFVRFWNEHVLKRIPPPPQTMQDVNRLFSKYKGRPVQLSKGMIKQLAERADLMEKINDLKHKVSDIEFNVACAIAKTWRVDEPENTRDDAALLVNGIPVGTWKLASTTRLDQKMLRTERPDIAKQFTRTTTHRQFDVSKPLLQVYNRS